MYVKYLIQNNHGAKTNNTMLMRTYWRISVKYYGSVVIVNI